MSQHDQPEERPSLRFASIGQAAAASWAHAENRLAAARQLARLADFQREVSAVLPQAELVETNRADHNEHRSGALWQASFASVLKGPVIYGDFPSGPLIENTDFAVLVTLVNCAPSSLAGMLRASVNGAVSSTPLATYAIAQLLGWDTLQVSLVVHGPRAGLGHVLLIELVGQADGAVMAAKEFPFDTAATYRLSVDSAHVYEARSVRKDTLVFGVGESPYRLLLGDYGDGDDIAIGSSTEFVLAPSSVEASVGRYFLVNFAETMSENDAKRLASKIGLVVDLFSGGLTAAATASFGPSDHVDGLITLSVSYGIWYSIIKEVLALSCNGVVAMEEVTIVGSALDAHTRNGASLVETLMFYGSDSPDGCGANSRYSVQRTITRTS